MWVIVGLQYFQHSVEVVYGPFTTQEKAEAWAMQYAQQTQNKWLYVREVLTQPELMDVDDGTL